MKIRNGFVSNSSSSCFVCQTGYCCDNKNYTIEETEGILQKILDFYNEIFGEDENFSEVFGEIKIADEKDMDSLEYYTRGWDGDTIKGKILIYSCEDNSIPYEVFDIIENKFNAQRIHLG
jgi:hypothetical protein